jgi:antitoxin ChpS
MATATLRRVGGSVMVAVPPDYLARTGLGPDKTVTWVIDGSSLVLRPAAARLRYTLAELLAECEKSKPRRRSDSEWTAGRAVGRELI